MRVKDLIGQLSNIDYQYQGDLNLPFSGLSLIPPKKPMPGRFLIPREPSWPQVHEYPTPASPAKNQQLIQRALAKGIGGIICNPELQGSSLLEGQNVFFAQDTFGLACQITRIVRDSLTTQRITAITGSAGKTSTKAMLVHALRASDAGRLSYTPGNKNLHRSTLHRISQTDRYDHTVLETSSSALKAFSERDFAVSPNVGIITSIAEAHLNYMQSTENIARVKSDLFKRPPAGGTAVINLDTDHSDFLVQRAKREGCQVLTYGESTEASIRLIGWDPSTHHTVALMDNEHIEFTLGPAGKHNAMNSMAVIAALGALGVTNWRAGVESLSELTALGGRGHANKVRLPRGIEITLIDEAYNSNPASVRASLASLASLPVPDGTRRVAVLGDILELGDQAEQIHQTLADAVIAADLDQVFLFGDHMRALRDALHGEVHNIYHWDDLKAVRTDLPGLFRAGDTVLMKASGATGLKKLVEELTTR